MGAVDSTTEKEAYTDSDLMVFVDTGTKAAVVGTQSIPKSYYKYTLQH